MKKIPYGISNFKKIIEQNTCMVLSFDFSIIETSKGIDEYDNFANDLLGSNNETLYKQIRHIQINNKSKMLVYFVPDKEAGCVASIADSVWCKID